jgi:hypothetical protein
MPEQASLLLATIQIVLADNLCRTGGRHHRERPDGRIVTVRSRWNSPLRENHALFTWTKFRA